MDRGFTLIEALFVIGFLALMTSFLILYNRTGEKQLILLKEKARIVSALVEAKNLSLVGLAGETLVKGEVSCGYGVRFEQNRYFIYRDLAANCQLSDRRYSAENKAELLADKNFSLPSVLQSADGRVIDVLFIPPLPEVFFDGAAASGEREIILTDNDRSISGKIIINSAGQVSAN